MAVILVHPSSTGAQPSPPSHADCLLILEISQPKVVYWHRTESIVHFKTFLKAVRVIISWNCAKHAVIATVNYSDGLISRS